MRYLGILIVIVAACIVGAWLTSAPIASTPWGYFASWALGGLMTLVVGIGWRSIRSRQREQPSAVVPRSPDRTAANPGKSTGDKPNYIVQPPKFWPWLAGFLSIEIIGLLLLAALASVPGFGVWPSVAIAIAVVQAFLLWHMILAVTPQSWGNTAWVLSWLGGAGITLANFFLVAYLMRS